MPSGQPAGTGVYQEPQRTANLGLLQTWRCRSQGYAGLGEISGNRPPCKTRIRLLQTRPISTLLDDSRAT